MFKFFKSNNDYKMFGPQGGISSSLVLPVGFNMNTDHCPAAILMHGFMAKKELYPLPAIANALAKVGIASLRFDFNAHGKSEGDFVRMTVSKEIEDARAVLEYVKTLPFISKTALLGHSQGGVIAGMVAGQVEGTPLRPECLVLLAPAAVLKDDAIAGQCMNARYNPADPPEYVNVFFHKLGREFIVEAQQLPIYETSGKYSGRVCIIHGKKDKIVPTEYSLRYKDEYSHCELHLMNDEGHMLNSHKKEVTDTIVSFLTENLF